MKTYIFLILVFFFNIIIVEAQLSGYPNFLIKNGVLNVTLIVGDKSSSVNVLAQATIASSLASFSSNAAIQNRLSSEVYDLNQNIISIGNPCINDISAKIMDDPSPCDRNFNVGKGYIKLFNYGDYYHLVVAGNTDLGTKKAAEVLANYDKYDFEGNEYIIKIIEDKPAESQETEIKVENKTQDIKIETIQVREEHSEIVENEDVNEIENVTPKENEIAIEDEIKEEIVGEEKTESDAKLIEKKKEGWIKRIITWFLSLFK